MIDGSRTAAEWAERLEGADTCATVVLGLGDAPAHPHNVARETFVTVDGHVQPAPAPRFGATPAARPTAPPRASELPDHGLVDWDGPQPDSGTDTTDTCSRCF